MTSSDKLQSSNWTRYVAVLGINFHIKAFVFLVFTKFIKYMAGEKKQIKNLHPCKNALLCIRLVASKDRCFLYLVRTGLCLDLPSYTLLMSPPYNGEDSVSKFRINK